MSVAHLVSSVTFAGTAITSLQDCTETPTGSVYLLHTDAAQGPSGAFTDVLGCTISITTTNLAYMATITRGRIGALVVTKKARNNGVGLATQSPEVATYANVMVGDVSSNESITGASSLTITFHAFSPTGGAVVAYT